MKTQVHILRTENPIVMVRRGLIAMMLVLFASMTMAQTTVVDIIVNSDDHESLEAAVIAAGLADALSGDGPFTVFAPTDAAFAALGQETIDALFADPTGSLATILQYHVVGASVMSGALTDGQIVEMFEGTDAFVSLYDDMAYINQAMITVKDLVADNGVVHVIDAVITQPESIVDIVVNSPRHESLEAAVIAAELADALSAEGTFTLFAPTDDAFAALGQETIDALFADPTGALADILKYHVVGATAMSGDLSDGDMFTTLAEKDIEITINEDGVFVNKSKVIFADYEAPNGVVHVVDAVVVEPTTVVDIIVNSDDHESLEAAVIAAGLADALSGDGPFTVFAPTDAAFAALGQETIDALFADPTGSLATILQYHVVGASVMSGALTDGQIVEMFEGTDAFVSLYDDMAYINQAMITVKDLVADNGVVHVIDAVITQPESIVDIVVNSPRHESLEAAVIAAELADALSAEGTFTLFAPTDDAFAALGQETIDALFADPTGALADILKYHVVGATAMSGDLSDGDMFTTLAEKDIEITINEDGVFVNKSKVIFADYEAPNGVVHVVDAVVVEPTTVVDIIVNSDDHESLEAAVIAAGLADALSGDGPFTVFAPTDAAFAALGQETIDALFADPTGSLATILQYHVVGASVMSGALTDGQIVEMFEGTDAFVSLYDDMAYINQAMITVKDLVADNGVVHVIDAVITQPESIVDIVVNSPRHESLEAAVIAAELADALSAEGTFTLFAPTDDAFAALGQETIDALFADPTGALADILKYHVVGATALSGDLSDGDMFTTLAEKDIEITINEDGVFVNNAKVIFADYEAPNGVVHVVDAVVVEPTTVVDIIVNSDVHESLEAAVIAAGLADALSGDGPFTVFAPTDAAFAALGQETIDALFADPTGSLATILQYHVVGASVMSGALTDGQIVEMFEGTDAFVSLYDDMAYMNQAMITVKDLVADNGVVHVIDAVITQPESIVDIVVNSPRHESLEAAVIAAELADALSAEGTFTLFAPTDDAFAALGQETIDALFADPTGALADILKYHVVGATALSGDLSDGDMFTTLAEKDIEITINEDGVFVNNAKVIFADYVAPNGVVHVIDAVLTQTATGVREMIIDKANVSVYPNPASDYVSVSFEVAKDTEISLELYDMLGQQVRIQKLGYMLQGSNTVEMSVNDLETGMYLLIINTGKSQIANKVKVVK